MSEVLVRWTNRLGQSCCRRPWCRPPWLSESYHPWYRGRGLGTTDPTEGKGKIHRADPKFARGPSSLAGNFYKSLSVDPDSGRVNAVNFRPDARPRKVPYYTAPHTTPHTNLHLNNKNREALRQRKLPPAIPKRQPALPAAGPPPIPPVGGARPATLKRAACRTCCANGRPRGRDKGSKGPQHPWPSGASSSGGGVGGDRRRRRGDVVVE
jgi:hypothetical protein